MSLGPGASSLILIFVILAMTVLSMLTLMNSRNDIRFSERSVQVTQAVYALQTAAEEKRAELNELIAKIAGEQESGEAFLQAVEEALPEYAEWDGEQISFEETDGFRSLFCVLALEPQAEEKTRWVHYELTAVTEEEW